MMTAGPRHAAPPPQHSLLRCGLNRLETSQAGAQEHNTPRDITTDRTERCGKQQPQSQVVVRITKPGHIYIYTWFLLRNTSHRTHQTRTAQSARAGKQHVKVNAGPHISASAVSLVWPQDKERASCFIH